MEDRKRKDEIIGRTVMGAVVSLGRFIADDNDVVGPLSHLVYDVKHSTQGGIPMSNPLRRRQ